MSILPIPLEPTPSSNSVSTFADYIQPDFGHALRIWWAYYWPTTVISFLLGILLARIARLLYENFIISAIVLRPILKFGSYVLSFIVAIFVFRYLLGKTFRHFKLGLLSNDGSSPAKALKPTMSRTLRVWWAFTWRCVVYGVIALALVMYPMGVFLGLFGPSSAAATVFGLVYGQLISGGIALFVIYSNILDEEMGDFRVVLLPRETPAQAGDPLAAMPAGFAQITK